MHVAPKGLVFAIYYPILAVIGVPANLAVIVILSRGRCGLSRCITYYMVSMAVTDLLVIITAVILNRIASIYFPFSVLNITPVCSLRVALNYASIDSSVWLTVAFTFDRFMAICCQKSKIKYCNEKMAARVIGTVCVLSCSKNTFLYFIYEPLYIINNIPWICSIKLIFYTSPAWTTYDWIHHILTPCLPFIVILLLNALTVRHILITSKARRRFRAQSNGENQSDPEMEKRRKSIVLLFCISGSFILLYLLLLITFLYVRIASFSYFSGSNFNESNFILDESGIMLQLLSSCINPFIYAGTQSKFRDELKNGVKYPLSLIVKLFKWEGEGQEHGEESAKQSGGSGTTLFHSILHFENLRSEAIKLYYVVHVVMEGADETEELWWPAFSPKNLVEPCSADSFECLSKIYESKMKGYTLFPTLLLELVYGEDYIHSRSASTETALFFREYYVCNE
ncbi:probable G-protein coupled receptor 139 [Heterodontus francisci]|uniref:probable G-protein coupled receptor 139 n=1 Tax=Heterodontus francisci TaxID=7792 RepID=UPI00355BB567